MEKGAGSICHKASESQEGIPPLPDVRSGNEAQETTTSRDRLQAHGETGAATEVNESWSMDFMSDQLYDGGRIRLLTLVDNFYRESLAIEVDEHIENDRVVEVLTRLSKSRDLPKRIQVDNGPEFISKRLDQWAYFNRIALDFIRPGKPTDNGIIEAFNGRLCQECLNENWFISLDDAHQKVED
ncbi:DDE-type integrase/transposase/recombinase [Chloroflexota bacterium]